MSNQITYLSEPQFYYPFGFGSGWNRWEWLQYLQALVNQYGPVKGADAFFTAWLSRDGFWANFADPRADWIAFDGSFRDALEAYTLSNGTNLLAAIRSGVLLGGLFAGASDLVGSAGDGLSNVGDGVNNLTTGAQRTTALLSWLVPVLVIVVIGFVAWMVYTNRNQIFQLKT